MGTAGAPLMPRGYALRRNAPTAGAVGGGGGAGTQKCVYQTWPDQIFPIAHFAFPAMVTGLGGGGTLAAPKKLSTGRPTAPAHRSEHLRTRNTRHRKAPPVSFAPPTPRAMPLHRLSGGGAVTAPTFTRRSVRSPPQTHLLHRDFFDALDCHLLNPLNDLQEHQQ